MVNIDKIKTLAASRGIKLAKLLSEIGEDSSYFSKVKKGLRRMDDGRIQHIANLLQTTYEYLTDQTDDPSARPVVRSCPNNFNWYRYDLRCMQKGVLKSYVESHLNLSEEHMDRARIGMEVLSDNEINIIAAYLDTTYAYLTNQTEDPAVPIDDRTGIKIKVFGDIAAGIPIDQIDNFDPDDAASWEEIDRRTALNGTYFALRIKGDSMEPDIKNGSVVIVRQQEVVESGQIAVVAINGNTATCKKVVNADDGLYLVSLNHNYPPKFYTTTEVHSRPIRILGRVVEARNKF